MVEARGRRPLVLIDIAVPRDIEPSVRDLCSGVTLFDMDDLQREVARNLSGREAEAAKARTLVDEEAERFDRWLGTPRRGAHDHGAARARRRRSWSRCCARTSRAGSRSRTPTASGSA